MQSFGDLWQRADTALFGERYADALWDYTRLVELGPGDLDARMRVADTLTALGDVQAAAVLYTRLAQHSARAGYPLRAMVALKVVASLEPQLGSLLDSLAALYARGSEHVGRGSRRSPPDLETPLPSGWESVQRPEPDRLRKHAEAVAGNYAEGALYYPDKLIPIPLLSLLPADAFAEALQAVRLVRARPGTVVVQQGTEGHSFFILARGELDVVREGDGGEPSKQLATLHEGAIFGEMALLSSDPRTASVVAKSACDLLEFDRDALAGLDHHQQIVAEALSTFARERLLQNTLATCGLFAPLDAAQRRALMRRFVGTDAGPGTAIIQEGQAGAGLYVLLRGHVEVSKAGPSGDQTLATLGPSDHFGEISLLNDEPTTASVTARDAVSLLFLERSYFLRLVNAVPEVRAYLEESSDARLMDTRISFEPGEWPALETAASEEDASSLEIDVEVLL